ncbi:MAG: FHA domain-containing protein [Chloroflexota bacterium]
MTHRPATLKISRAEIQILVARSSAKDEYETTMLTEVKKIVVHIGDAGVQIPILDGQHIEFGRFEKLDSYQFDLTPYDAFQNGISRRHAQIHIRANRLFLVDMGSSNGTFIGDARLMPAEPQLLQNGQEITLGRLQMTVYF